MNIRLILKPFTLAIMTLIILSEPALARKAPPRPDYTKGERPEGEALKTRWALGSTGAFGFIYEKEGRQILIDEAIEGSPSDRVLLKHDVILGTGKGGEIFEMEARHALAKAIEEAEKNENGGKLTLVVFRPETEEKDIEVSAGRGKKKMVRARLLKKPVIGKTMTVTVTLKMMGSYSPTAPWGCDKSEVIIARAAEAIVKEGFYRMNRSGNRIPVLGCSQYLDALGLLATGDIKYLPVVTEYAHAVSNKFKNVDILKGDDLNTWNGAYANLFLTEYYLATKDDMVLPGIKGISTGFATGRSGVGTFSHGMAYVQWNGLYGPASAYGAMNQCSITAIMSLVLAQKCGVRSSEIDKTVELGLGFLRWYVDKGTIPYGDHKPAYKHDNNGRNSQAAVLFDLAGDGEAASFFSRSTLASYEDREAGHTGHYFGTQWGSLGAARGGPEAAQSFIENTRWFTEMERRFDGSFRYQCQLSDYGRYPNWSTAGQRLMQSCVPRQKIYITGRGGSSFPAFSQEEVLAAAAAARFASGSQGAGERLAKMSVEDLLKALGNWSMVVRGEAAKELGRRDEDVVKQLIAMLASTNRYARYGACLGLRHAGRKSEEAVDALVRIIEGDKDMTFRYFALQGLELFPGEDGVNGLGEVPRKAVPALLKLAAVHDPAQDPSRKMARLIALSLFSGQSRGSQGFFPGGKGIEKMDRALLFPALRSMLTNPNGEARSQASLIYKYLTPEDLEYLWADIYKCAKTQAPSGVMFAGGARDRSLLVLSQNHFSEALPLINDYLKQDGWGKKSRVLGGWAALPYFGSGAKDSLPFVEKDREGVEKWTGRAKKSALSSYQKLQENLDKKVKTKSLEPYLKSRLKN